MRAGFIVMVTVLAASVAGCDKKTSQDDAAAKLQQQRAAHATPNTEPIEKTVTVLAAPSVPQQLTQREASVMAERGNTEARVHDLMNGYAQNLGDAKSEKSYREQLARELEIYKKQSLELFKLQQRAVRDGAVPGAVRDGTDSQQFHNGDTLQ